MSDDPRVIDLGAGWYRIPEGWTAEEVTDDIVATYERSRHSRLSLPEVRGIRELVDASFNRLEDSPATGGPVPEATEDNVRAERARRIKAGEPYGAGKLAEVFLVHESTIRRRLGRLKK